MVFSALITEEAPAAIREAGFSRVPIRAKKPASAVAR